MEENDMYNVSKEKIRQSQELYDKLQELDVKKPQIEKDREAMGESLWIAYEALRKARIRYGYLEDKTKVNKAYQDYKAIEDKCHRLIEERIAS